MGAQQIRDVLHYRIEQADERFLKVIYAMVEAYAHQHELDTDMEHPMGFQAGEPLTLEELKAKVARAESQADQGMSYTVSEVRKEASTWLKGSTE